MTAYSDNPNVLGDYVTITSDSSASRYSRAQQINAERRRYERVNGVQLELIGKSYSETHGFLAQSKFRYRIDRPESAKS